MQLHENNWNQRYLTADTPWETGEVNAHMQRLFQQYVPPTQSILEIGCGVGTNAQWLAKAGYQVTGIDISEEAIRIARERASSLQLPIEFLQVDIMHDIDQLETYPVVFDCAVYHLFSNTTTRQQFVHAIAQLCHDDGYWISIACSKDHATEISRATGVNPPPTVALADIVTIVEPSFEIIEIQKCDFTIERTLQGRATFAAWASVFKKRSL